MGRRQSESRRKKGGGLLSGMRGGFRNAVQGAVGIDDEAKPKKAPSKAANIFWNIVTGILLVLAALVFLRRCGVIPKTWKLWK